MSVGLLTTLHWGGFAINGLFFYTLSPVTESGDHAKWGESAYSPDAENSGTYGISLSRGGSFHLMMIIAISVFISPSCLSHLFPFIDSSSLSLRSLSEGISQTVVLYRSLSQSLYYLPLHLLLCQHFLFVNCSTLLGLWIITRCSWSPLYLLSCIYPENLKFRHSRLFTKSKKASSFPPLFSRV